MCHVIKFPKPLDYQNNFDCIEAFKLSKPMEKLFNREQFALFNRQRFQARMICIS